jgi:hypothetical protein
LILGLSGDTRNSTFGSDGTGGVAMSVQPPDATPSDFELIKFLFDAQDRWLTHKLNCVYDIARMTLTLLSVAAGWVISTNREYFPPYSRVLVPAVVVLVAVYGCVAIWVNNRDYSRQTRTARLLLKRIQWGVKEAADGGEKNAAMLDWPAYDESRSPSRVVGHCAAIGLLALLTLLCFWAKLSVEVQHPKTPAGSAVSHNE